MSADAAAGAEGGVVCAGRLYADLVFDGAPRLPSLGTEVFARGLSIHAGGGAFIAAAWLATLGRPAALAATWPAAPFEVPIRVAVASAGVDASACVPAPPGTEPQVTVAVPLGGDRALLTRAAGPALPEGWVPRRGPRHLHPGELATAMERPDLIAAARAAGMTVSLDCAWEDGLDPGAAAPVVAGVDVFPPNEAEAERLGPAARAAPLTVVTLGPRGAVALGGHGRLHAPGRAARPVDATGAGDAFDAGFLDAWLSGRPLGACLAAGNACGAAAVEGRGGTEGIARLATGDLAALAALARHAAATHAAALGAQLADGYPRLERAGLGAGRHPSDDERRDDRAAVPPRGADRGPRIAGAGRPRPGAVPPPLQR